MSPAEQSQIDAIERDRKRREREMLALLLIFFGDAINHAAYAVRLGHDPTQAARDVLMGNPALGLMGLSTPLTRLLATTYINGTTRSFRMASITPPDPQVAMPGALQIYAPIAQGIAGDMTQTLADRITAALADAATLGMDVRKSSTYLKGTLRGGGYGYGDKPDGTQADPWILETATETGVVNAHGAGMWNGFHDPAVDAKLIALCET